MKNLLFLLIFALAGTFVSAQVAVTSPSPVVSSVKAERTGTSTGQVEIRLSGVNTAVLPRSFQITVTGNIIPGGSLITSSTLVGTRIGSPVDQGIYISNFPIQWVSSGNGPEFVEVQFSVYDGTERRIALCCMMP